MLVGCRQASHGLIDPFTLADGDLSQLKALILEISQKDGGELPDFPVHSCPTHVGVSLLYLAESLAQNRKCGSSPPSLDRQEWKGAKLAEV